MGLKTITPSQRLAISVSLGHLEAQLDAIESLLSNERDGLLRRYVSDLTTTEVSRLRSLLAETRRAIAEAALALGLQPQVTDVRRAIAARLGLVWETLEDTQPFRLRRYGNVDPSLEASLGPHIQHLIAQVHIMESIINGADAEENRT